MEELKDPIPFYCSLQDIIKNISSHEDHLRLDDGSLRFNADDEFSSSDEEQKEDKDEEDEFPNSVNPEHIESMFARVTKESVLSSLQFQGITSVICADAATIPWFSLVDNEALTFPCPKSTITSSLATLKAACVQSPFGDLEKNVTRYDAKIRSALETTAIRLTPEAQRLLCQIKTGVSERLFGSRPIDFKFNKVNLYTEGGHFNEHKDTPRDGVVGTMVIELPIQYKGNGLGIKVDGKESFYRHEDSEDLTSVSTSIVCFYGHLPHRVDRVESGTRLTLSFYIVDEEPKKKEDQKSKEEEGEFEVNWDQSIQSMSFRDQPIVKSDVLIRFIQQEEKAVGYFLGRDYSMDQIERKVWLSECPGIQSILDQQQNDSKLKCDALPVLVKKKSREYFGNKFHVFRFTPHDIQSLRVKDQSFAPLPYLKKVVFLNANHGGVAVQNYKSKGGELTGNEIAKSEIDCRYYTTVLVFYLDVASKPSLKRKSSRDQ